MYIKRLQQGEILDGLHLVWEVFAEKLAPAYTPQGVMEFQTFIKLENVMPKVEQGDLVFWGAYENTELCGVAAVQSTGHLSLLFVRSKWEGQGVSKMLFAEVYRYCTAERGLMRITVNAAPQALEVYRRLGFRETAPQQTVNGITFIPMEEICAPGDIRPAGNRKSNKGLIIGICVGAGVLLLTLGILFGNLIIKISQNGAVYRQRQERRDENDSIFGGEEEAPKEETPQEKDTGIEAIPSYAEENLPYTIEEETYTYYSDGRSGEYPMEFDIRYPQIKGLGNEYEQEINAILKDCAMSTVNTLYLEPSEELKEAMLQEESPFMASQVTYKVSYAGADFISVVFNDHYFSGNYYAEFVDLRTRNLNLTDGTRYETADIVKLDDTFMADWIVRMKEEAPDAELLSGLKLSQFKKILDGEILENRYYDNFFVDADGIEIGVTYHYQSGDNGGFIERGWITAPYTMEEIAPYKSDNSFWKLVDTAK